MAQGRVTVNNLNLNQGEPPDIERKALMIGVCRRGIGRIISVNAQTDLDEVLGSNDSELKTNAIAAQRNGGPNWFAYLMPQAANYTFSEALDVAMDHVSPEIVAVCTPVANKAVVESAHVQAVVVLNQYQRRLSILLATPGISSDQSWYDYELSQIALQRDIAANRVALVPQLHGNDLGVLTGRLCNTVASIADTPMRTATGPVVGLGSAPVDKARKPLRTATLSTLDSSRLSCIQTYPDYPGIYWGDCNMLETYGGDYYVIEHLRVIDKLCRHIRLLAIARIGNRQFNSSKASIAANKTYFMRPMRAMSRSTQFAGDVFPGEIHPPASDAIEIIWQSRVHVQIFMKARPYYSPKFIEANVSIDLTVDI